MYQAIRTDVPGILSRDNSAINPQEHGRKNTGTGEQIEVCWLPSLPLTKKHKAPPIGGLGILYSEELEKVLHVFETDNLQEGIHKSSRDQAAALNVDPGCRLHWLEISNPVRRAYTRLKLLTQTQTA